MNTLRELSQQKIFYNLHLMPCCFKHRSFFKGPQGGMCTNIKCYHCGQKWNICPPFYIEKI